MSVTIAPSAPQTAAPTYCTTCGDDAGDNSAAASTTYIEYTTTFSWSSANWILSATQPVCTWQYHCLGDSCKTNDDCDNDWECRQSICQPCCYARKRGLTTPAVIGIGVGVPVFVAILTIISFLVWRAKRKKRRTKPQRLQRRPSDDYGKPELEAPGVPLDDRTKRAEMDFTTHPRAELSDTAEVAVEADSMEPSELEDTSKVGQQKYRAFQISEPPPKTADDNLEEVRDIIGMYETGAPVGVLPSPSLQPHSPKPHSPKPHSPQPHSPQPHSPQPHSPQPHSPSPTPDWPLPRDPSRSPRSPPRSSPRASPLSPHRSPPRSPTSGNFLLSSEPGTTSVNARSSPVSDVSNRSATEQQAHRLSPRSPTRILPYGMIDRFDEDDDDELPEESVAYHGSPHVTVHEQDRPDGRPGQESVRRRWSPLPREEYH